MDNIRTAIKVGDMVNIAEVKSGEIKALHLLTSNGYFYKIYPGDKIELKVGDLHLSLFFNPSI